MAAIQKIEIAVGSGTVNGSLHLPHQRSPDGGWPAVLICRGSHVHHEQAHTFIEALVAAIIESDVAAVVFDHRCADLILEDYDAHTASDDAMDVMAVWNWMQQCPDIDRGRIGVMGYSLGSIAATSLAKTQRDISRICLLAAPTADYLVSAFERDDGDSSALMPERLPAAYVPSLKTIDSPGELSANGRPTLIVHGAADRFVPPAVSHEFANSLNQVGSPAEHVLVARGDHTFSNPAARHACFELVTSFFQAMSAAVNNRAPVAGGA